MFTTKHPHTMYIIMIIIMRIQNVTNHNNEGEMWYIVHKKITDSLHIVIMRIQNVTIHNNYCEMWNSKYSEMPTFMQFHLPVSSEIKYSLNLTIWSATSVKYGEIIKKRCILGPAPKWPYFNVNLFAILLQWIHCFLYCKGVSLQKRY